MRVEVEIRFDYAVRRRRRRNLDAARETVTVEAEVPVVDARPAIRVRDKDGDWRVEAYWDGDRLLRALPGDPALEASERLGTSSSGWDDASDPSSIADVVEVHGREEALGTALSDYRDRMAGLGLAVVDGTLCAPCAEPVIQVRFHDRPAPDGRLYGWASLEWRWHVDRQDPSSSYRNVNGAERLRADHAREGSAYFEREFEVLVPEAFGFDDEEPRLGREALFLVASLRHRVEDADLGFFAVYAEARDRLRAWQAGGAFGEEDVRAFYAAADLADAVSACAFDDGEDAGRRRRDLDETLAGTRFAASAPPRLSIDDADADAIEQASGLR